MRKTLISLALLSATAGLAQAQGNVTVYGIVDTGYIKETGKSTRMGHNYSSRIGFRGAEDLGHGNKATFELEQRLDLNNGKNGTLPDYDDQVHGRPRGETQYQGAANLGLAGSFGQLRFGRVNAPGIEAYRSIDPFFFVGTGRSLGYETRLYAEQITNSVRYDSPVINGFSGSLTYSLKGDNDNPLTPAINGATDTDAHQNHGYAALIKYGQGPLTLMGQASRLADANQSWYWNAGATYRFGPALVGLGYQSVRDKANFVGYDVANKTYMLTLQYDVGAGIVKAAWNHGRISHWGDNDGSSNKYVLGYTHNLSKRVSTYAIASWTDSDNNMVGSQYNPTYGKRESVSAFQVGMTYRF